MNLPPIRSLCISVLLFATIPFTGIAQAKTPAQESAERWARYEPEFKAFAEADRITQPAQKGILFVGSSIFRQWTNVAEMMAPLPALNRAFGGSRTIDQLDRFDQVVPPYAPRIIVYYCGSNDLKADVPPEEIFANFQRFSERARALRPDIRIVFVSSTRAPDRVAKWTQVDHYNALAWSYCTATPGHTFIDLNPVLVDATGQPRLELYQDDKLHFHPPAYSEFSKVIKPVIERIWHEIKQTQPDAARAQ